VTSPSVSKPAPSSFVPKSTEPAKSLEELIDQLPEPEPEPVRTPVSSPAPPRPEPELSRPAPAKPAYELDQGYSLPDEIETAPVITPSVAPQHAAPQQEKLSLGRIQIEGTENAEIISANALQLPVRVKIGGDTRIYRMDLAIKLDGFKSED
jgi:hypothetical protein